MHRCFPRQFLHVLNGNRASAPSCLKDCMSYSPLSPSLSDSASGVVRPPPQVCPPASCSTMKYSTHFLIQTTRPPQRNHSPPTPETVSPSSRSSVFAPYMVAQRPSPPSRRRVEEQGPTSPLPSSSNALHLGNEELYEMNHDPEVLASPLLYAFFTHLLPRRPTHLPCLPSLPFRSLRSLLFKPSSTSGLTPHPLRHLTLST